MKSRNIVFSRPAEVEVREEEITQPGPGEVLCRAALSLVSLGTEGHCLRGIYDPGTYWEEYIRYPFHPGYSMAARVVAVGDGVTSHRIGDRVTSWAPHSEYFLSPESQLFAIPDAIRDDEAIWATLARTTQLAVRRAELTLGESAAVVGLGMLGQLVTQYVRLSGARDVIAIDISQKRLDLAAGERCDDGAVPAGGPGTASSGRYHGRAHGGRGVRHHRPSCRARAGQPAAAQAGPAGAARRQPDAVTPEPRARGSSATSIAILGIHGMMYPDVATPFNQWTAKAMTSLFFDYVCRRPDERQRR